MTDKKLYFKNTNLNYILINPLKRTDVYSNLNKIIFISYFLQFSI